MSEILDKRGILLRYAEIVMEYYGIGLTQAQVDLVDAHFVAASHNRFLFIESQSPYHREFYFKHLFLMMCIVGHGDFSNAYDRTYRQLDSSEGWSPLKRFPINIWKTYPKDVRDLDSWNPDPEQFDDMCADPNYSAGEIHPFDHLCDLEEIQNLAVSSF